LSVLLFRIVGIGCYLALGFLILGFIFTNRAPVSVELFPLGATGEMPLYVVLCSLFVVGLLLGLLHSAAVWLRLQRRVRRAERAIAQLEKEIAAREQAVAKQAA
jgi:uncharacterized integral membrane protein